MPEWAMTDLTLDSFVHLEQGVWRALCDGDPDADSRLLSSDFLGVYPSGFSDRSDHAGQLSNGPTAAEYTLSEAVLRVITNDHVLLSYRADWRRLQGGRVGESETMYVSSLWSRSGTDWLNVFSQDTPAAPSTSVQNTV